MNDGARIYEVRARKTGELLARGTSSECAKKIGVTRDTITKLYNTPDHKFYDVRHIGHTRKILCVYHVVNGMVARGTIEQVASDMNRTESAVYGWVKSGHVGDLAIEVIEEIVPVDIQGNCLECKSSPCGNCSRQCRDALKDCKAWRIWFSREYRAACDAIRRMTTKEGLDHGN